MRRAHAANNRKVNEENGEPKFSFFLVVERNINPMRKEEREREKGDTHVE